ncbi:MAG: MgtC/SapB family protein [Planctomycetota bacterium]|jgi:uncharacterized membrane protein (DUF4010 family)
MILEQEIGSFLSLGIALGIGLLIGLERGWERRKGPEGSRVAGLRTFGLIGLAGACSSLIAESFGEWFLGLGLVAVAIILAAGYLRRTRESKDIGTTTAVAGLLTFCLGALVPIGYPLVAVAAAVVTTILLSYKPTLHAWVEKIEKRELRATFKLLLISVVLLPVLPDEGYGPWQAFNPYEIWWMVVLVAGISYVGYFAMKIGGAGYGSVMTGIFGGLAASTAATLTLAKLSQRQRGLEYALAAGILAAGATMYLRILVVASVVNPLLFPELVLPVATMTTVTFAAAALAWRRTGNKELPADLELQNPFQLLMAVRFGVFLAAVLLLSRLLVAYLGDEGVYYLAAASGVADVDAITLSLSRMSADELPLRVAGLGIIIAAVTNGVVKSAIAVAVGGKAIGWRVVAGLLGPAALGVAAYFMLS